VQLWIDHLDSPVGRLSLVVDADGALRGLGWLDDHPRMDAHLVGVAATAKPATDPGGLTNALRRYFAGELAAIAALPVVLAGTPFQQKVWTELRAIPCGETWSYGQLARRIGNPAAVRAVGLANGSNPVAIVVPCHRVIGSDGTLTGYGGGLDRKRWLLAHESRALSLNLDLSSARPARS
jgi:methylated-DNA-[protein]-cysteine S-methyltransferase